MSSARVSGGSGLAPAVPMALVPAVGLRLEPLCAARADELFEVLRDPALHEFEGEPPESVASLRRRFAALEARRSPNGRERWLHWVIRLDGGEAVGCVQATVDADGHAAIAYELGSAWWGCGLACRAVEAMLRELAARHGVRRCRAVLKRENLRSYHLLRRLRFVHAPAEAHLDHGVERDEWMMWRRLAAPAATMTQSPEQEKAFR